MALAISSTVGNSNKGKKTILNVTGGSATTKYDMSVSQPDGSVWAHEIVTDGSGNFSMDWNINQKGTYTVTVTPKGTGAATTTFTGV